MHRDGWLAFAAWVLAGALAVFSFLAAASIGLFVLPFAGLAIWLSLRLGRRLAGSARAGLRHRRRLPRWSRL